MSIAFISVEDDIWASVKRRRGTGVRCEEVVEYYILCNINEDAKNNLTTAITKVMLAEKRTEFQKLLEAKKCQK